MPEIDQNLTEDDWRRDRRLVMSDIRRMSDNLDKLTLTVGGDLTNMKIEVATLKTKVALYAAGIAAIFSIILSALISYLMKK